MKTPRKILFPSFNKIGDTIFQTQLIHGAKTAFPDSEISALASPPAAEVLKNNPHLHLLEISDTNPDTSFKSLFKYFSQLRKIVKQNDIDTIICDPISATPSMAFILNFLRVPLKIFGAPLNKKRYLSLTKSLVHINKDSDFYSPMTEQNQKILEYFGQKTSSPIELFPSPEEISRSQAILQNLETPIEGRILCVAPFTTQGATQWPTEHTEELLEILSKRHALIVLGTKDDFLEISQKFHDTPNIVFSLSPNIRESFILAKRSDLLISLDSGPAHFFLATSKPLLKINSHRIPPEKWGYHDNSLYHEISFKTPCGPCFSKICPEEGHPCMTNIRPATVAQKVEEILYK